MDHFQPSVARQLGIKESNYNCKKGRPLYPLPQLLYFGGVEAEIGFAILCTTRESTSFFPFSLWRLMVPKAKPNCSRTQAK